MSQTCPNCGFINKATNRFCSNCGVSLVPASTSSEKADAASAVADSSSQAPSTLVAPAGSASGSEPVTYLVQTWDSGESATAPAAAPVEEERVVAPPRPTFVPYGGFSNTSTTSTTTSQPSGYMAGYGSPATATPIAPPPVSPDRAAGGTYSPYSPEAARKLEAQKPQRSWLLPSVGAAAILLLVLVAVGAYLLLSNNSGAPGTPSGSGSEEDTIKAVIKQSNDDQITSWHTLDTSHLGDTRTGQVLQDNIQQVEGLKSSNLYAIPVNNSLQYGTITVNGNTATAKTVEVWTITFYSQGDNKVVQTSGPDTLQETYHFVKVNGKWLINALDIVQNEAPTPAPGTNNT